MTTIRSAIQRLAKAPGKTLDDPRKPEQINGTTGLMTWPQEAAASDSGSGGGGGVATPVLEGPLTEVPDHRTYWPTTEIFDEEGVVSVEVAPIQSILVEDENGNRTRVYLTNPYT